MIIHKEFGEERNSIIEFSPQNRNFIRAQLQVLEEENGFDLPEYHRFCNSYDCDDYLFVSWLINQVVCSYDRMNYIPQIDQWRDGYRKAPYIHVHLYDGSALEMIDGVLVPNDKKLGLYISGPKSNGGYVMSMDRCYLLRYIQFLSDIFDSNHEMFINLEASKITLGDGSTANADDVVSTDSLVTKEDILRIVHNLRVQRYNAPADALSNYAQTLSAHEKVPKPIITFLNNQFIGLHFYDSTRNVLTLPLKKTIYNTSGFAKYFNTRNDLIQELFIESFAAMFSHEFAHVANGHCLLAQNAPDYTEEKYIRICAEQNADDTAIRLRISDPLFEGENGNPHDYRLALSAKELIHVWSIRSLSMHLGLSWMYRDNDRKWDEGTLQAYIDNRNAQHPLYQFRTFNVINRILDWLSSLPDMPGCEQFQTKDGHKIDHELVSSAIKEVTSLIYSFESCFETTYGEDNRSMEELLRQSWKVEENSLPTDPHRTPYLMPFYNSTAMSEVLAIKNKWPELKRRLEESGTYSKLYDTI